MTRIKIIVNPISGRGRAMPTAQRVAELVRAQGADVEVLPTSRPGDARREAEKSAPCSAVVCVGGDGTVNEVLNGLPPDRRVPIGMIPMGTANVLAKELKLPRDPEGLARMILARKTVAMDIGMNTLTGQKFLLMAGAGYDADAVHRLAKNRRGTITMAHYIPIGLQLFWDYRLTRIRVEIDNKAVKPDAQFVLVANVRSYGGPMQFTHAARFDDGLFDVFLFRTTHKRDFLRLFPMAFFRRWLDGPLEMRGVEIRRGRHVRLESDEPVPLQLDGDPASVSLSRGTSAGNPAGFLPAEFTVISGGATVLVPLRP